jgi:alkaline phosphatase
MRACRFVVIALVTLFTCAGAPNAAAGTRPRNIILFIGDGMGFGEVELAALQQPPVADAPANPAAPVPPLFCFERFPVAGTLSNRSANSLVTDSAAAATALACGAKTNNGTLGLAPDGTRLESMAELAKKHGKAVGIVSSVGFDHATPAGFYAHSASRDSYEAIVEQALTCKTYDVLFGGGVCATSMAPALMRTRAEAAGLAYFDTTNFKDITPAATAGKAVLGAFDANNNDLLDFLSDRTPECPEPRLADVATKAVDLLLARENGKGFFLMVEGGAIDWACHGNNAKQMCGDVREFDRAIAAVLAQLAAAGQLEDTLIVVTADHETGGLVVVGPYGKPLAPGQEAEIKWSTGGHSAMFVPLYATGPEAQPFHPMLTLRSVGDKELTGSQVDFVRLLRRG